jgi:hypothetical protein
MKKMKKFDHITFKPDQCITEVAAFKKLLRSAKELSEQDQLLPFFQQNHQLCALMGKLHPRIVIPDLLAREYDLFGDFACDFVIGQSNRDAYCFIEFEDAKESSIFKKTGRATAEWSNRFEHGFSQLVDWIYKLHDTEKTNAFADRFHVHAIDFTGVLIIGRSQYLTPAEQRRLKWREQFVVVHSQKVHCLTFDDLLEDMEFRLTAYPKFL